MTANVEKLDGPDSRIEGYIDARDGSRLYGWAWDRLRPQERLRIEISDGATILAEADAAARRPDLAVGGIGDGAHAFEIDLGDKAPAAETMPNVVAISPSTGERVPLQQRVPDEPGTEVMALLRQVAGAVDLLGRGQRRLSSSIKEKSKTANDTDLSDIRKVLADIADTQKELQKQQDSIEVFLVRFEAVLRQLGDRMEEPQHQQRGGASRLLNALLK